MDWPQTVLPYPSKAYSLEVSNSTLRTAFDSGRTRQRPRFTQDFRKIATVWELDDNQFLIFQSYIKRKLLNGALWFNITLPMAEGYRSYSARFVNGTYKSAYKIHLHWNVSATLEVEECDLLSEEILDLLIAVGGDPDAFEHSVNLLYILVEETLPTLF
jgi:hypothetical protein